MTKPSQPDREPDYERQKLVLEYVKTAAILIGVIFGLIGIWSTSSERELARFENTSKILTTFSDDEIRDGFVALNDAVVALPKSDEDYFKWLHRLTPLHEHLVTWSMCISSALCDTEKTIELYCQRVVDYEYIFSAIRSKLNKEYDRDDRLAAYYGVTDRCDTTEIESHP